MELKFFFFFQIPPNILRRVLGTDAEHTISVPSVPAQWTQNFQVARKRTSPQKYSKHPRGDWTIVELKCMVEAVHAKKKSLL